MGSPAARIGDPTVHGGAIAEGCPTVLIGNPPAHQDFIEIVRGASFHKPEIPS